MQLDLEQLKHTSTKEAKMARAGLQQAVVTSGGHFAKTLLSSNQGIIDNIRRHITTQISSILSQALVDNYHEQFEESRTKRIGSGN